MKRIIFYLACMLCIAGCDESISDIKSRHKSDAVNVVDDFVYFKDSKTNLCFVGSHLRWNDALMTSVPCSPEVEKLIKE